ncbi:hypothetical protein CCR97_08305 [Rhodoplanes elegans]|uniref:Uncharacterized protein n=1 Tax=Rhodoplanes elegans TaxID=29408 RepID=A0A327KVJ0_9BRAD|nr:hypothetical protein [Rhodoplanes elegans]MBK5958120.1 hypothetical protein [Rhodoplanes elegans]MBK5958212.1 hypothetical protein [Rhodoplanes elegans]RAI41994.1 hypothetical protein CH338_01445 [Rhodoplanes elegans]
MAVAVWPGELPEYVLVDGFSLTQPDGRLRTPTDTGPGKTRLKNSAAMTPVAAQVYLKGPNDMARFRRFWAEDLAGGVLPFVVRDPRHDGALLGDEDGLVLADEDGAPIEVSAYWLAEFDAAPAESQVAGYFSRLSFTLLVFPG